MSSNSSSSPELGDEQLRALYSWIDAIPLSRPKKNLARDFSDGVLFAEVIAAYFPQLVELHNYAPANSIKQKHYNFETLNTRVLKKFGYTIPNETIDDIVCCRPGAVEFVLNTLQFKMAKYREKKSAQAVQSLISNNNDSINNDNSSIKEQPNSQTKANKSNKLSSNSPRHKQNNDDDIIAEKDKQIRDLHETIEILELKIAKLEQLVKLKDNKIQKLMSTKIK